MKCSAAVSQIKKIKASRPAISYTHSSAAGTTLIQYVSQCLHMACKCWEWIFKNVYEYVTLISYSTTDIIVEKVHSQCLVASGHFPCCCFMWMLTITSSVLGGGGDERKVRHTDHPQLTGTCSVAHEDFRHHEGSQLNVMFSPHRTIRVWLKRDSGQYWPSVHHTMSCKYSCLLQWLDVLFVISSNKGRGYAYSACSA